MEALSRKWTPWPGGKKCPLRPGTTFQATFRCGHETTVRSDPQNFVWRHRKKFNLPFEGDIVSYRVRAS